MKQVMKRKVKRVKRTDDVDFETSYKRDASLAQRIDAALVSIGLAINDAKPPLRNGCVGGGGRQGSALGPRESALTRLSFASH